MKLTDIVDLPRSEWERMINEWIFSERDRKIIKHALLDGYSYEQIAYLHGMSTRQIARIVTKLQEKLLKHIQMS